MSSSVGNYNQTATLVCPKCKGRHVGNTCVTCFLCNEVRHYKSSCPKLKREAVNSMQVARPRAQGRVLTMSGAEVGANEDLIQGTCNINEIPLSVLFDSGATHSFITIDVVNRLALPVVSLPYDLLVFTPTSEPVIVSTVCSQCPITSEN
ncbi:PREDICTED: uncharacterized protein LOC109338123 [Lupinus angustifolius]|uniref:uncharacterized protein LOC109338123 n=1 Tax=Lupinus angustifolius TaxID=3871 RepID=UPI00092EB9B1|nr:PREDICTED: uncharacterized protein LOC109338123 [Lupinus angustifolius]